MIFKRSLNWFSLNYPNMTKVVYKFGLCRRFGSGSVPVRVSEWAWDCGTPISSVVLLTTVPSFLYQHVTMLQDISWVTTLVTVWHVTWQWNGYKTVTFCDLKEIKSLSLFNQYCCSCTSKQIKAKVWSICKLLWTFLTKDLLLTISK